ncbi:hypothetical protein GKODMF_01115 [Candidatus Electrothrix gigas]
MSATKADLLLGCSLEHDKMLSKIDLSRFFLTVQKIWGFGGSFTMSAIITYYYVCSAERCWGGGWRRINKSDPFDFFHIRYFFLKYGRGVEIDDFFHFLYNFEKYFCFQPKELEK